MSCRVGDCGCEIDSGNSEVATGVSDVSDSICDVGSGGHKGDCGPSNNSIDGENNVWFFSNLVIHALNYLSFGIFPRKI